MQSADTTTAVGGGVSLGGFLVAITDWSPAVGVCISIVVGVLTCVHLYRCIKISALDEEIRNLEIKNLRRRKDDPKD